MKVKARTTVTITKAEICEAIKLWAEAKGIVVEGEIGFQTAEQWDPDDWQGKYGPIGTDVTGAYFTSSSQEHDV